MSNTTIANASPSKSEASEPALQTLQEYATSQGLSLCVDREAGIIPGVKILGAASRNGRHYPRATFTKALPLYEGAKVNVNHARSGQSRPYQDRIGVLRNVRAAADGLYADLHFNPKHALAEQLCWDAEHAPNNVGFSHDVEGKTVQRNGQTVVESIDRVISVDLVSDPATTQGLFEDEAALLAADPSLRQFSEEALSAMADARSVLFAAGVSLDEKRKRLLELLERWQETLGAPGGSRVVACNHAEADCVRASTHPTSQSREEIEAAGGTGGAGGTLHDLTIERLKEYRMDLVEQLSGQAEVRRLAQRLQEAQLALLATTEQFMATAADLTKEHAQQELLVRQSTAIRALRGAGINEADPGTCSEAFLEALLASGSEPARQRLIEDRARLLRLQAPRGPVGAAAPLLATRRRGE